MEDNNWGEGIQVLGQPDLHLGSSWTRVNADYFDSVGTRVVMGREITENDTSSTPTVAVVNKEFAQAFFHGENPIGQHFGSSGPSSTGDFEIVGVVADTAYDSVRWKHHLMYFVPLMQRPTSWKDLSIERDESLHAGAIVLETERPMDDLEGLTRQTLASINANLTVVKFQTFDQQIAGRFTEDRMIARLTMLFGGLALLLATVGLYGVTAFTVARRTSEIGIRVALGAERIGVIGMVLGGAMLQAALGLGIIPTALFCVRFVESQLYEVNGVDTPALLLSRLTLVARLCWPD